MKRQVSKLGTEETEEVEEVPFQSDAQRKFLFAKEPAVAKKWAEEEKKLNRTPLSVEERRKQARAEAIKKRAQQK